MLRRTARPSRAPTSPASSRTSTTTGPSWKAYTPILEREFAEKYDAKLLMMYAWPSQQLWCNLGDKSITQFSLNDLEGKKIRVYSTTLGDFVEGVGGSAG